MTSGDAKWIFEKLDSKVYDDSEKLQAIKIISELKTFNGIKKSDMVLAIKWLLDKTEKKFKSGDKVYHKNLKLEGEFLGYAWESDDEADVEFMVDGEIEQRHVSINQLVKL